MQIKKHGLCLFTEPGLKQQMKMQTYIPFLIQELIESIPVNTDKRIGTTNLQIAMQKTTWYLNL